MIQHLSRSIDFPCYLSHVKTIEYLFQSTIQDFSVLIDGENVFDTPIKIQKKHTKRLLKWEGVMIIQQVVYWITIIFQSTTD